MEKKENKDIELLNRIYQDATVGTLAIDKILKKIEDDTLRKLFSKQFEYYQKFAERCDVLAMKLDGEVKENSFFKKAKQTAMLYMSLWMDKSPRHIVELMITGTTMGIVDTIKAQKDLKTKNEEINTLVAEFKKMQEEFYEKLKKQLAKV
ncbi:MAG: hypothetical protein E7351_00620 [Clostridiales bacterium]|nr:hypothetical protein [Clostridiales bacterium]